MISLFVSSPDTHSERRIPLDLSLAQLKDKLFPITGIQPAQQRVTLQRTPSGGTNSGGGAGAGEGEVLAVLDDDSRTLESYGVRDYMTIRVESTDPFARGLAGQYTDDSKVDKFELTQEEYEARRDTVHTYKRLNQLGRFAPSSSTSTSSPLVFSPPPAPLSPSLLPGARCQVALSDVLTRRGTVRFVGPTKFGAGDESTWVGVEWDEPVGKGDGSVDGTRYFTTLPLRASFVRPDKVTVGDFPEEDPFADLDEDEEM